MEVFRGLDNLKSSRAQKLLQHGSVLSIGNFDGVHVGHQQLCAALCVRARQLASKAVVMLFEPQPQEFFLKEEAPARLSFLREKVNLLSCCGIDILIIIPFNRRVANCAACDFVEDILIKKLKLRHLFIGSDFRFGRGREGDMNLLKKLSGTSNFHLSLIPEYLLHGTRVSSTRIRQLLRNGDLSQACELLGRPYARCARVGYGDQLGRTIGFPTANLLLQGHILPMTGVFAVRVTLADGTMHSAVANLGVRPTVNRREPRFEVHILDFEKNLYLQHLTVTFIEKIRDERKFADLTQLKTQIAQDIVDAREILKK